MKKRHLIAVSVLTSADIGETCRYVREAVKTHGGAFEPGNPFFALPQKAVRAKPGLTFVRAMRFLEGGKQASERGLKCLEALQRYHRALKNREHGGIAADRFVRECQNIFHEYYQ